jgi:very-short-patch-repair endonuclease
LEARARLALTEAGLSFVAEKKIGRWSVDFLVEQIFVLETDGTYWHATEKTRCRDARRDAELVGMGFRVVRVSEKEVKADPSSVIRALLACGLSPEKISADASRRFASSR